MSSQSKNQPNLTSNFVQVGHYWYFADEGKAYVPDGQLCSCHGTEPYKNPRPCPTCGQELPDDVLVFNGHIETSSSSSGVEGEKGTDVMSESNNQSLREQIDEYFWPHPFDGSGHPLDVSISSGLPPMGKVFQMPYSMLQTAILSLVEQEANEARAEEHDIQLRKDNDFIREVQRNARIRLRDEFLRQFTNDHDLSKPPRWLRGVALDEEDLLAQILSFFEFQLKADMESKQQERGTDARN